ncbi:hypothetical protein [Nonomuraea soli]|uniref:Uncharacterized protein n=1 Tax=Nonomuraea soli TaxID=1032476 RepID=A0A7W0HQU0_9ACTN|nr:hypothetical protein [Nonomuraea soli]MBA2892314.1 hypothetical protein [Nonomuraea soli]
MSENTTPEPGQDKVEELIDDLEVHAVREGGTVTEDCNLTSTCNC